ncbi:MAG: right-handed parallel beta-helix repeat-containing protein [Candidatus Zixiibacteriota bacterium]
MSFPYRKVLQVMAICLALAVPSFAQYSTFVVDDNGDPLTTFPTLAQALTTAQTYPNGPHKIVIMAGAYSDYNLTYDPTKVDEIYGDPAAAVGDIVFTSPAGTNNFITAGTNLQIRHMTLDGYKGIGVLVNGNGVTVEDMVIVGGSGYGVYLNGVSGVLVQNLALSNLDIGVYSASATGSTVQDCSMDNCGYGAALYNFTGGGVVDNLDVFKGNYGIYLDGGTSGAVVKHCTVDSAGIYGVWLNAVGSSNVDSSLVHASGNYGIVVTNSAFSPNWIRFNCLINNGGAGSQGYDDGALASLWTGNFYSDQVYTMAPGLITDANPQKYLLTASTSATTYNLGDIIPVDFEWAMPACGGLDSQLTAAYNFTVNFDNTKLAYVAASADYDGAYLGPAPPALYTNIVVGASDLTFAAANFTTPGVNGGRLGFANFEVIGANTTTSFSFSGVDFRDPGNNPLPFGTSAGTLTLVDNVAPVMVSLTANNPAGDDTYSDGSVAGPGPFLKLYLTMSATDNFDLDKFQWNSNGGAWSDWIPVPGVHPLTAGTGGPTQYDFVWLALPEGTHTAGVRVKDAAGLVSNEMFYTYTIDRTAPVLTSLTLQDYDNCNVNINYTNAALVKVDFAASGDMFEIEYNGGPGRVPYADPDDFTLSGGAGGKTVTAYLFDKYNNRSSQATDNITLDLTAPAPTGWGFALNKTNSTSVSGTYTSAGSGAVQLAVSEDPDSLVCGSPLWQALGSPVSVTLSSGDGMKYVYFATRDYAGNISTPLMDSIELDQTPVTITAYDLQDVGDFDCTENGSIEAVYAWSGPGATTLQWSYDNITWGFWKNLTALPSPDSTAGGVVTPNAWNLLYIRIVDDVGNISTAALDSIFYDAAAPTLGGIVVADAASTATPPAEMAGVTNSTTFLLKLSGLSADITALKISEDGGATYTEYAVSFGGAATFDYSYTWSVAPAECAWLAGAVKTVDCAGNESAPVAFSVYFDFTSGPVITSYTGPAMTNNPTVTLNIAATDNCWPGTPWLMRFGEGSLSGVPWEPFAITKSFTFTPGDGYRTVNMDVADIGGNLASGSVTIYLDQTAPGPGTFVITGPNPLSAPGYTDNLAGNTAAITWDADVVTMWIQNSDGSNATGPIPAASPHALAPLSPAGVGLKTVNYWFLDLAGNWSPMYSASIDYSNVPPAPPTTAVGIPMASTKLMWTPVVDAKSYYIRSNRQNQYPLYPDPVPPHPLTFSEGNPVGETADTFFVFPGPGPDIYSFSIWTLSKHGLWSPWPNVQVTATNYILGDFYPTPDGCIKFTDEFGALASAYSQSTGDPGFNMYLDIAPTIDATATGYPIPDGTIDFEDLVIFAINYDSYACGSTTKSTSGNAIPNTAKPTTDPVAVEVVVPSAALAGSEVVLPVMVRDQQAVKGYHVILDYNTDNFELVAVESGKGYEAVAQSFFFFAKDASNIDVSGVVLGSNVTFTDPELFRVILRAKTTGAVDLTGQELTFRDRQNQDIKADLSLTRTAGVNLPTEYSLSQNYPNPFNPATTIELALPQAGRYKLTIYNVLGQVVESVEGFSEAGVVHYVWDASRECSGVYLYRLEAGTFEATRKMILLK